MEKQSIQHVTEPPGHGKAVAVLRTSGASEARLLREKIL
jgi:hypothetical protein